MLYQLFKCLIYWRQSRKLKTAIVSSLLTEQWSLKRPDSPYAGGYHFARGKLEVYIASGSVYWCDAEVCLSCGCRSCIRRAAQTRLMKLAAAEL